MAISTETSTKFVIVATSTGELYDDIGDLPNTAELIEASTWLLEDGAQGELGVTLTYRDSA